MVSRLLNDAQRLDWLRLIKSENVGPATFRQLVNKFGGAREALEALPELSRRGGMRRPIRIYPQSEAERDLQAAQRLQSRFVAIGEAGYPKLLAFIEQAPPLICIKGNEALNDQPMIAIVGARNASALGRKFCRQICAELGASGHVVVSGLARGIDTAAHEASVTTGTVAVLAGGLDVIYPPENEKLYDQIAERGVLITEMTPGTRPRAEHFPRRNRIVSGMSLGVVVVEAALRSGSLITARLAGEQGREVFAVPGSPLDPRCAGTNKLIKDGAVLVNGASDILEVICELSQRGIDTQTPFMEPYDEGDFMFEAEPRRDVQSLILDLIGTSPVEVDDLIRESGEPANVVLNALLELELAGRITRPGLQLVVRSG